METPPLVCPVCAQELVKTDLGGIPVATCHEHGRWLGHAEAEAIVNGLEKELRATKDNARRRTRRLIRKRRAAREARERSRTTGLFGSLG